MENKVMVIRYDGKPPRQVEWQGKPVAWIMDTMGFPVIITCQEHAALMATGNPDRYRLYRSKTFPTQVLQPNGSMKWENLSSWYYEKKTFEIEPDDNGERKYKDRIVWNEDKEGRYISNATEEFITGKKKSVDETDNTMVLKKQLEAAEGLNQSLTKQVGDLTVSVEALMNKVESMEKPKTKGSGSKGK